MCRTAARREGSPRAQTVLARYIQRSSDLSRCGSSRGGSPSLCCATWACLPGHTRMILLPALWGVARAEAPPTGDTPRQRRGPCRDEAPVRDEALCRVPPAKTEIGTWIGALALYQDRRYEEAMVDSLAAQAIRKDPRLLLDLGHAYRRLRRADEALKSYHQFLAEAPRPPPRRIAQRSSSTSRAPAPCSPNRSRPRRQSPSRRPLGRSRPRRASPGPRGIARDGLCAGWRPATADHAALQALVVLGHPGPGRRGDGRRGRGLGAAAGQRAALSAPCTTLTSEFSLRLASWMRSLTFVLALRKPPQIHVAALALQQVHVAPQLLPVRAGG